MSKEQTMADAIIQAAHIISNNGATTPEGASYGGLEAHGMIVSKSIDRLASAFNNLAHEMSRIADAVERQEK